MVEKKVVIFQQNGDNWIEAERLFWLAYVRQEARFGASHPTVIGCLKKLSHFYRDRGKFAEFEVLCWHVWETKENEKTIDLTRCLKLLAALYSFIGRCADAIRLLSRVEDLRVWKREKLHCFSPGPDLYKKEKKAMEFAV